MSQHVFSPDSTAPLRPAEWYRQASQKEGFIHDTAQAAAIERLDALWAELMEFKKKRNRFLGRSLRSPDAPRGLYLWGGVGRGKSFLMDAFFSCVPYRRKRRVHFHHFMAEVHNQLKTLSSEADPLLTVADRIARATRLLCFDEFHVSDIADAMILSRLLGALFERDVVMVMTSNYPPDGLYPNGLQRMNFLPAIDMLKKEMDVLNVDGGHDYRLRELTREPLFQVPSGSEATARMQAMFDRLRGGVPELKPEITLFGRRIRALRHAPGVIWFDFMAICGGPRGQADYLEIAREYHTVFISDIPQLAPAQASEARRFTWLVDVFYDHRVKLVASAAAEPEALYPEGVQASEFFRTASRLTEMQSTAYLELPHLRDDFDLSGIAET
ncbi:Predicted ATPase [Gulbenkiania indica]|uniref:Predicted ATPase n=2 Tax=Gulbenkiania TaxID=397456 RepID=A0A0K6GRQ1_9NEIS|nr:cell division protein ZapE [Gulbenkiania indica]TCW32134.1 cell division protein ZapE [Gulbenkiania mobilis]CUA81405.1 Predicted ATPase [Gulbenkiania indica]